MNELPHFKLHSVSEKRDKWENPLNEHLINKQNVQNITKANLNLQKIYKTEMQ